MSDNLNTIGIRGNIAARTPDYRYTLPEGGKAFLHAEALLSPARAYLPFFSYGMGWVLPACIGLIVGLALHLGKKQV